MAGYRTLDFGQVIHLADQVLGQHGQMGIQLAQDDRVALEAALLRQAGLEDEQSVDRAQVIVEQCPAWCVAGQPGGAGHVALPGYERILCYGCSRTTVQPPAYSPELPEAVHGNARKCSNPGDAPESTPETLDAQPDHDYG